MLFVLAGSSLVVVAGLDEPHDLAIKEELEAYYETEIQHGRLYPNLDELVDKGLIKKDEKDGRTNVYTDPTRSPRARGAARVGTPVPHGGGRHPGVVARWFGMRRTRRVLSPDTPRGE